MDLRQASGRTDHKSDSSGRTPCWSHPCPVMSVAGASIALAVGLAFLVDVAVVEDETDVDRTAGMVRGRPSDVRLDPDLRACLHVHRTPALRQKLDSGRSNALIYAVVRRERRYGLPSCSI